jgi:hypothetical protein
MSVSVDAVTDLRKLATRLMVSKFDDRTRPAIASAA